MRLYDNALKFIEKNSSNTVENEQKCGNNKGCFEPK